MATLNLTADDAQALLRPFAPQLPVSLSSSGLVFQNDAVKIKTTAFTLQTSGTVEWNGLTCALQSLTLQADGALKAEFNIA